MANNPNIITRSTSLADLLATSVSDGTYEDVIDTPKVDKAGHEVPATGVPDAGGQLWSNFQDDAAKRVVQNYYKGVKLWSVDDATERDALGSVDDLAADDLLYQRDNGVFYICASVDGGSASTWERVNKNPPQDAFTAIRKEVAEATASTVVVYVGVGWPTSDDEIDVYDWVDMSGANTGDPPAITSFAFTTVAGEQAVLSVQRIDIDYDTTDSDAGDLWLLVMQTTAGDLLLFSQVSITA